ncbi:hypothetical protein PVAG01_07965 [Phlyctema vagabunda]|uniref:Uncharacterized protein n=1 Tax=Phlyctema vagabunda TaxID=108571 RepID=A0ABR4PE22_9HELO
MVSATDVITYVGVPLAVIGVMPIFYTFITALYTRSRVSRACKVDHIQARISSRLMSGIVDVDMPIYKLNLDLTRGIPAYWKPVPCGSAISGSKWRAYPFARVFNEDDATEPQKISLRDQIRLPRAHIRFDDLVRYLVDIGVQVVPEGFALLRADGINTRNGTIILKVPGGSNEKILEIIVPKVDDSILSLRIGQWVSWEGSQSKEQVPGQNSVRLSFNRSVSAPNTQTPSVDPDLQQQPPGPTAPTIEKSFIFHIKFDNEGAAVIMRSSTQESQMISVSYPKHVRRWLTHIVCAAQYDASSQGPDFTSDVHEAAIDPHILSFCGTAAFPLTDETIENRIAIENFLQMASGCKGTTELFLNQYKSTLEPLEVFDSRLESLVPGHHSQLIRCHKLAVTRREAGALLITRSRKVIGISGLRKNLDEKILPVEILSLIGMWSNITRDPNHSQFSSLHRSISPDLPSISTVLCDLLYDGSLIEYVMTWLKYLESSPSNEGVVGATRKFDPKLYRMLKLLDANEPKIMELTLVYTLIIIQSIREHSKELLALGDVNACLKSHPDVLLS